MFTLVLSLFALYGLLHFLFALPDLLSKSKRIECQEIAKRWKRVQNSPLFSVKLISYLPQQVIFVLLWLGFIPRPKHLSE